MRPDGRQYDQLRPVTIDTNVNKYAEGSALIAMGDDISGATADSVTFTVIRAETTDPTTGLPQPLTVQQTAKALGVTDRTVRNRWRYAKALLFAHMNGAETSREGARP